MLSFDSPQAAGYELAFPETVALTLPPHATTGGSEDSRANITASPLLRIDPRGGAARVKLEGTLAYNTSEAGVRTGGSMLVISLLNDSWVSADIVRRRRVCFPPPSFPPVVPQPVPRPLLHLGLLCLLLPPGFSPSGHL